MLKGISSLIVILLILIIVGIGTSGYILIKQQKKSSDGGGGNKELPVTTTLVTTTTVGITTTISMTTTTLVTTTTSSNDGGEGSVTTTISSTMSTTSTTTIPIGTSYLHTDGKWIKDEQGNVVILHGLNHENYAFNNFTKQFANGRYLEITEADYQKIASWGFNVVRLGIAWQNIEPTEGSYDESYFANSIDKNIEWAKNNGIYVVLSFMQWGWSPYFDELKSGAHGFPSWLFTGYEVSDAGIDQSRTDFLQRKGPSGTEATPSNPSMQDRMINAWKYVATRYKNEPTILGYDLFNEPPGGGLGEDIAMDNYLLPFYERLVDEIKTVDSNHIFIYESIGGHWDFAPRLLDKSNVIFSTHIYNFHNPETEVTHCWSIIPPKCGYNGDITILQNQINGYLNLPEAIPSKNWNIPIYVGEFGIKPQQIVYTYRYKWINDLVNVLQENKVFYWTDYSYCHQGPSGTTGCEWSVVNPDGTEITAYVNALDKPYPRVSSVPPEEYSFNSTTKHFNVVFNGYGNVKTEIYVPSRYYPTFTVNSNSISWSNSWNATSRVLTVSATLNGPIEITIDST